MTPAEELLAKLQAEIGTAEVAAAMELIRMDEEHKDRKDRRWRRMLEETRDIRQRYTAVVQEIAQWQITSPVVILDDARAALYHGDVDGDCDL